MSAQKLYAALIELLRLKDLKDTFPALLKQVDEHGYSMPYQKATYVYERDKPAAWAAARAAIAESDKSLGQAKALVYFYKAELTSRGWNESRPRVDYLVDFCDKAVESENAAMHGLGFIQGSLWMLGIFSTDELKEHLRKVIEP